MFVLGDLRIYVVNIILIQMSVIMTLRGGHAEDYMRNLNNQGILGDDMHLLCGQIVKIHNRTSPSYWKLSAENQCSKHFITTKQWHQDLFEEPSKLRGIDNVDET